MSACSRLLLLALLGLISLSLNEVRAEQSCLELRVLGDDKNLHWIRKTFRLDVPKAETVLSIDPTGTGKKEIILKNQDGKFRLLSISPGREISMRLLENLASPLPNSRLDAIRTPLGEKEVLAWVSDFTLSFFPLPQEHDLPPQGTLVNLDPQDFFRFSRKSISWRCNSQSLLSVNAELSRPYPLCPGCYVAVCLHLDAIQRISSRTFNVFSETAINEGPADLLGNGVESYLASEENRGLWQVGQSVGINTPWAEFPTKVRWQQSLLGDFNGDQRTDILVLADLFRAAWLATSEGTYAVERAVENPFSLKGEQGSLLAADLDGDGVDDVANVHEREGKLEIEIAFRSPPPPSRLNINLLVFRSLAPLPLLDVPWWLDRQERISVSGRKEVCEFEQKNYFLALAADSGSMTLEKISFADKLSKRRTFFARDENPDPRIIGAISDFHGLRQTPAVCTGYYPEAQFPRFLKWGNQLSPCPESYAILGAEEGSREGRLRYAVDANCCPLPATDILGNEHVAVEESCPENFVMTGTLRQDESCADCPLKNRCTKINTERYQLSAARPGRYWGNGFSGRFQKERLQASDIPVGIRYGVTRTNYSDWSTDGCIGSPMGALLTKRVGKKCDDSDYRELLYRGIPGDPPAGTPVLMFPKCRKIENVFDPRSGCYPEK